MPNEEERTAIVEFGGCVCVPFFCRFSAVFVPFSTVFGAQHDGFDSDKSRLAKPDAIVMALHDVSVCSERVNSFLFKLRFPPQLRALNDDVITLETFCSDAKSPLKFKRCDFKRRMASFPNHQNLDFLIKNGFIL